MEKLQCLVFCTAIGFTIFDVTSGDQRKFCALEIGQLAAGSYEIVQTGIKYERSNGCSDEPLTTNDKKMTEFQCVESCFKHTDCEFLQFDMLLGTCMLFETLPSVECFNKKQAKVYLARFSKAKFREKVSKTLFLIPSCLQESWQKKSIFDLMLFVSII